MTTALVFATALLGCKNDTPPNTTRTSQSPVLPTPNLPPPIVEELPDLAPDTFYDRAGESVVLIRNVDASSMGSGVEIRAGVFVTNCHVLENGNHYFIERGGKTYPATLARQDKYHDICLLHAFAGRPHPAETRPVTDVRVGERVYALGNPQGFELSLSEGLVSQLRRARQDQVEPYIQTTAAISQGSSGGGLFDRKGRLIGVSSFIWREGQNLNFAAPIDWALALDTGPPVNVAALNSGEATAANAESLNEQAIELINAGRTAEAVPLLQQAAGMAPNDAEIAGNLGYAYLLTSKYMDAREVLLRALELAPKRSATWLNLGQTYAELNEKDAAVRSVVNGYLLSSRKQKVWAALSKVEYDDSESNAWKDVAKAAVEAIDAQTAEH